MAEGLRERKKRQTRQHISDMATGLFLERGFDAVTIAEIAGAADVSVNTVYNYAAATSGSRPPTPYCANCASRSKPSHPPSG